MIVVDTTVVSDLLVGEERFRLSAQALVEEDPDWISTTLWRYEFGNVLLKYHRHGRAALVEPEKRFLIAEAILLETVEKIDCAEIWAVAVQCELSFYDASYVWLARSRGLRLRTRDKRILRECADVAMPMPEV